VAWNRIIAGGTKYILIAPMPPKEHVPPPFDFESGRGRSQMRRSYCRLQHCIIASKDVKVISLNSHSMLCTGQARRFLLLLMTNLHLRLMESAEGRGEINLGSLARTATVEGSPEEPAVSAELSRGAGI
jgi:hypothetical protein